MGPNLPRLKLRLQGKQEVLAQMINISTGGLRLALDTRNLRPPRPGEDLLLSFCLVPQTRKHNSCPVMVRYTLPGKDPESVVLGLDFYPLPQGGKDVFSESIGI